MKNNKKNIEIKKQIDRYVNGQLSESETEDLWAELIQDEEYMDYLHTSANLKEIVAEGDQEAAQVQDRSWIYAAAAVIVILLAVLGTMRMGYFDSSPNIQPVETIELDYYRSTEAITDIADRDKVLRNALELFSTGKFNEAVNLLNSERNKATDAKWVAKLDITLGTLFYNEDKFNDAAYYFKDVIKYEEQIDVLMLEKAYWYLGNSYFQMDMLTEAEDAMQKTYNLNGAYSRVAKSYLDAMENALANQSS